MNFLAPIFLAGAAAVVLPILFHLVRQSARRQTVFSSLMFLKPAVPRLTRRNKVDHLLLLILRVLIVALVVVAFARPYLLKPAHLSVAGITKKSSVVLLDTSASMQREGVWSAACQRVLAIVSEAAADEQLTILAFDEELKPVLSFEDWQGGQSDNHTGIVRDRLAKLKPRWFGTRLDRALIRALETLDLETKGPREDVRREIILVSDFTEGCSLDELAGYRWPADVTVRVEQVLPNHLFNAGIHLVDGFDSMAAGQLNSVRIRIICAGESTTRQFQVGWAADDGRFISDPLPVALAGGEERIVSVPFPGNNLKSDRLVLRGDDEPFDNMVYTVVPEGEKTTVSYIGPTDTTSNADPIYFLARAFGVFPGLTVDVRQWSPDELVERRLLDESPLLVVAAELGEPTVKLVRDHIFDGGTVLFVLLTGGSGATLAKLLNLEELSVSEQSFEPYGLLSDVDTTHPMFSPFAEARFGDFTKVKFWKHRRIDLRSVIPGRVIATFDNGDPAVLDVPVGRGRLLVFTAGWHPADSQLALSSKFVPMMHALLGLSMGLEVKQRWLVGQPVPVRQLIRTHSEALTVIKPDGTSIRISTDATALTDTDLPGIYKVQSTAKQARFAVNILTAESRTTPLQIDQLTRLGVRLHKPEKISSMAKGAEAPLPNSTSESRQELWRWFIAGALVLVLTESVAAGLVARSQISTPK